MAQGGRFIRRVTAMAGGAALAAAAVAVSAVPAGAGDRGARVIDTPTQPFVLNTAVADNPLAGATGRVHAVVGESRTTVRLHVRGVDAEKGTTLPAHVHVGPCSEATGGPAGTGGHYNSGGPVDDDHESWVTFTVNAAGKGVGHDTDNFAIPPGAAKSITVHAPATGARLGCLPVDF